VANRVQGFFQFNLFGDGTTLTGSIDLTNAIALTGKVITPASPSALPTTPAAVLNISPNVTQIPPLTFTGTIAGSVVSYTASRGFGILLVNFTIGF
jgi:hypothetical protein